MSPVQMHLIGGSTACPCPTAISGTQIALSCNTFFPSVVLRCSAIIGVYLWHKRVSYITFYVVYIYWSELIDLCCYSVSITELCYYPIPILVHSAQSTSVNTAEWSLIFCH